MTKDLIKIGVALSAYIVVTATIKKYEDKKSFNENAKMAAIEEATKAVVIAKDDAGIAQAKLLVAINAKDTEAVRVFRDRLVNATKAHGEALTALKAVSK